MNITGYVDVIVGLSSGSEGKGKIAAALADEYDIAVRTGGVQAGHTIHDENDNEYKMQTIPCFWINPGCRLVLGAGALINYEILEREIKWASDAGKPVNGRLFIDRHAGIVEDGHMQAEAELRESIASTCEGVGAATVDRIWRRGDLKLVKDMPEQLAKLIEKHEINVTDTAMFLNKQLDQGARVILEGTQGMGLDLFHGPYPFVTSRSTIAANWFAEAGLSPTTCRRIYGVVRTFPTRVGGNSGGKGVDETTWDKVKDSAKLKEDIVEISTVTKRTRRVFQFSKEDFQKALALNRPTHLCITGLDYLNGEDRGKTKLTELSKETQDWLSENIGPGYWDRTRFLSTGPGRRDMIDLEKRHAYAVAQA